MEIGQKTSCGRPKVCILPLVIVIQIANIPREFQLFLLGYIVVEICEIFSVGGIPLDRKVRIVCTLSRRGGAGNLLITPGIYWNPRGCNSGHALDSAAQRCRGFPASGRRNATLPRAFTFIRIGLICRNWLHSPRHWIQLDGTFWPQSHGPKPQHRPVRALSTTTAGMSGGIFPSGNSPCSKGAGWKEANGCVLSFTRGLYNG